MSGDSGQLLGQLHRLVAELQALAKHTAGADGQDSPALVEQVRTALAAARERIRELEHSFEREAIEYGKSIDRYVRKNAWASIGSVVALLALLLEAMRGTRTQGARGTTMSGITSTVLDILQSVGRIGDMLANSVDGRLRSLRAAIRAEARRLATALILSLLAALCGFAALVAGAAAILIANWATHPVLAASLIAGGFAVVALVAVVAIRGNTRQG